MSQESTKHCEHKTKQVSHLSLRVWNMVENVISMWHFWIFASFYLCLIVPALLVFAYFSISLLHCKYCIKLLQSRQAITVTKNWKPLIDYQFSTGFVFCFTKCILFWFHVQLLCSLNCFNTHSDILTYFV